MAQRTYSLRFLDSSNALVTLGYSNTYLQQ
uniref:Uncharacterized protein n=1 Tax=virus sp. ctDJ83 TaxID=2827625 RepID=A0A8S5RJU4_9VIRU|nr:MAG TPA: hypothetical protein [virus sp. ctDJ83]